MPRMLPLKQWALDEFGDAAPSNNALNHYAKHNMIALPPKKVGCKWMVEKDAHFVGLIATPTINRNDSPVLKRILSDGR